MHAPSFFYLETPAWKSIHRVGKKYDVSILLNKTQHILLQFITIVMLSATIRPSSVLNSIFPLIWAESPLNAYVPQRYPPIGRVPHFNSKSV